MKIAIVCLNLSWQAGGVRLIYSSAHAMKKFGHHVIIYAPEINETAYPDLRRDLDIRVIPLVKPIAWQYQSSNVFARVFEKIKRERTLMRAVQVISEAMDNDLDVVNVHDFSYRLARVYRRRNPTARIIWTMNDPPYMYLPKANILYDLLSRWWNAYKDIAERKYFKAIDAAIVLVRRNKQWVEERGMKGKVVWSGLEFERFSSPPKHISGKKTFTVLGVGALNKYRRFEDIVAAVRILRGRKHDVRAVIVCKNIWGEDDYAEELVGFAQKEGVSAHVMFHFEGASDTELKQFYASSDFFILPIHLPPPRDGFGWQLVPFEAMAAGTPVIVSRKIDIVEALHDGETACFVDPCSPEGIANKIETLIKNPERYHAISSKGREFVKNKMSWETYVKEVLAAVKAP